MYIYIYTCIYLFMFIYVYICQYMICLICLYICNIYIYTYIYIYLATCKICNIEHIGQATDSFRSRWNKYKSKKRKFDTIEKCMQEYLHSHFESEGQKVF